MSLSSAERQDAPVDPHVATRGFAAGGLAAGVLGMSCCILPLVLVSAGVGGAWMSYLTALSPYQPYFLGAAALSIGAGFWRAYRKPRECAPGSPCASPSAGRITKSALWIGAVLAVSAATVNLLVPYVV